MLRRVPGLLLACALLGAGCTALGYKTRYYATPDHVKVIGQPRHAALVKSTFWTAAAKLEAKGLCKGHRHKITKFEFKPGTYSEPGKGWGVWDSANKMYIAGSCGSRTIMIVVDPNTGALNPGRGERDMIHEWGHALLAGAGLGGTWQEQHGLMGF